MRFASLLMLSLSLALASAAGCRREGGKSQDKKPAAGDGGAGAATVDLSPPADVAAPPADAQKTASGLRFKVLKEGTGKDHPEDQDRVTVHYTGWTTDGKMFDSSHKPPNRPRTFGVTQVIPGWTEGLKLMTEGAQYRFWIPVELAYNNQPGKPAGMLVFDVELVSITKGPKPIPAPADVAAPPADAQKSKSGLAWKVLKEGTGKDHPDPWDRVTVNLTGWTQADGKMIETTQHRQRPITIAVDGKMPGFEEVLPLMVTGEQRRVWIPEPLAFQDAGQPSRPKGAVTYDIELVGITDGPKPIPAPPDVAAPPKDAQKTASGLLWKVLQKGKGKDKPSADATVEVHYTGWTTDGKMFDSSVTRNAPARFPLKNVIPGWTEGLQLMTVGEKRRFWIPVELAYNNRPGKPKGMLVFDVELLSFTEPPKAPPDVAAPPADAEKTPSGLASKVLQKGTGAEHPTADSTVEVHYTGWTTDGKMFDSSVVRGRTAKFPLKNVIPGWTEGLQLMTVGEKRRFWIPKELAYNDQPGKPKGMLVFDIELIAINPPATPAPSPAPGAPSPTKKATP